MNLSQSKTKINLMKAFAGESQARNRYTFSASRAKSDGFAIISKLFLSTADQEKEHAKIFFKFLEPFSGGKITIDVADYPIDLGDTLALLKFAQRNETAEHDEVYREFSEVAAQEGFDEISEAFSKIAKIEKTHAQQFAKFAELIENDELFKSKSKTSWACLNCGHTHEGTNVPEECPVCSHPYGFFLKEGLFLI